METLKHNREFLKLYKRGASMVSPALVTYLLPTRQGRVRIGITASTKIGGAVQRNRARRIIRAAFQELSAGLPGSCDIVFVARSRTTVCGMAEVKRAMEKHLAALLAQQGTKK